MLKLEKSIFYGLKRSNYVIREKIIYTTRKESFVVCRTENQIAAFFKDLLEYKLQESSCQSIDSAISNLSSLFEQLDYSVEYFTSKSTNPIEGFVKLLNKDLTLYFKCSTKATFSKVSKNAYEDAKHFKMVNLKLECLAAGIDIQELEKINIDNSFPMEESLEFESLEFESPFDAIL